MSTQSKEVRLDEVLLRKVDQVSNYVKYIGRADGMDAVDSDKRWQISRTTILNGVEKVEYAKNGSYVAQWSLRSTYFGAFTNPSGIVGSLTVGASAVAVRIGGSDLADRKEVSLSNESANTLYWGFDNTVTTTTGYPLAAGARQTWLIEGENSETEIVPTIYIIAAGAGNATRVVESP